MSRRAFFTLVLSFLIILNLAIVGTIAKNYDFFITKANSLTGKIIFIDPGHGGLDNGTHYDDVFEDYINLQLSEKVYSKLIQSGAIVIISRSGDYDLASVNSTNRKREDMKKRVELINKSGADLFLSIHLNAYPDSNVSGAQVFYRAKDSTSGNLATSIQDNLNTLYTKEKKVSTGDYYLFNYSQKVGVIIECGFLSNSSDRNKLVDEKYQNKFAQKIVDGLVDYLKLDI